MKNIILIGMPGCGKTTFGRRLAKRLELDFYDADEVLQEREGRTIKSFFEEGESAFRAAETRTIAYLCAKDGVVISTGGGVVTQAVNRAILEKNGLIVFIDRHPEQIIEHIRDDSRPLLASDRQRIFALYDERIEHYRQWAHHTVANDGSFAKTLALLTDIVKKEKSS